MATKKKSSWAALPKAANAFDFSGDALKKAWKDLHAGDTECFPDAKRTGALIKAAGRAAPKKHDEASLAEALQAGWAAFHEGHFEEAFEIGTGLGVVGASLATKAMGIHAAYLVTDADEKLARFETVAELAEAAIAALPLEANSHYRRAFGLGRYSQGISIAKALKQGLAGKVRDSLEKTLAIAPDHAEAQLALAVYHAEIVSKVGGMIGGLTYGAKASEAEKLLASAMKVMPKSPVVHLEQGHVALLIGGSKGEDVAVAAYEKAAKLKPRDAMEWLDAHHAASQIE
jgi:tetratricopeptide (TPR) repeat protein